MVNPLLPLVELGSGAAALAVAIVAWRHRDKPAGMPLVVIALAGTGWAIGLGLQSLTTDWLASVTLQNLVYLSTDFVAIGWLYLAAEYAGREWFQRRSVRTAVLALLGSNLLAMTINPSGNFYAMGTRVASDGVFFHVYGPLYWLNIFWKYGIILVGAGILVVEVADRTGVYREQSIAVLFAGVVPSIFAFVEIVEIVSIRGFSLSAIGIAASGAILLWSLFYADFLELPSIAQRTLMENMDAAVVAVDSKARVIDRNARAISLFDIAESDLGGTAETVFAGVPAIQRALDECKRANGDRSGVTGESSTAGKSESMGTTDGGHDSATPDSGRDSATLESVSDSATLDGESDSATLEGESDPTEAVGSGRDTATVTTEMQREGADGTRYYEISVSPITPVNEGVSLFRSGRSTQLGRLLVVHDITDRRRNEKRLERANEQLDQFAAVISHDLRNPLSVASGYLELARERGDEADFETIEQAHERMDRMIDDMLTMARAENTVTDTEPVELPELARRAWETTRTEGATLVVDLPEGATVEGDEDLLQHVFENLFRNAVEHNEPPLHVRVGALEGREGFYIEDDGRGIRADERENVFGQGHTTSDDGSGLGLSIVEELLTAHEWAIDVTESIEGGARFEIETNPTRSGNK